MPGLRAAVPVLRAAVPGPSAAGPQAVVPPEAAQELARVELALAEELRQQVGLVVSARVAG